ncbi:MAG: hypothetical protein JSR17_09305 [Proteobacteria bacterium]|nr:hypothetical protein [Pseudomonadota bacterium]
MNRTAMILSVLSLSYASLSQAAIYYVNAAAASGGNGSSWSRAFNNLDSALSAANLSVGPDQIWVARGTYKPAVKYNGTYTGNEPNLVTFKLPSNVSIFGGFKGTESSLAYRVCDPSKTILSGDIQGNDINDANNKSINKSDNAWHVLTADGATKVAMDCFTVTDGYAGGPDGPAVGSTSGPPQFNITFIDYAFASGGGLLARHGAQVALSNMIFNYDAADSSNATIRTNPALGSPPGAAGGGAIAAIDGNTLVTINNAVFDNNSCLGFGCNGGSLNALLESSYKIALSSFTNNAADRIGGAIHGKNADHIDIAASLFNNNIITGHAIGDESGGSIGVLNTNLSVITSSFSNSVSSLTAGGGGIFFHSPFDDKEPYTLSVSYSSFNNNTAGAVGGGAINISGNKINVGTKANISNCLFYNNNAGDGGAVYTDGVPTVMANDAFIGNTAGMDGGAIFASTFQDGVLVLGTLNLADRKLLSISNSVFKNNAVTGVIVVPPQIVFNIFASALSGIFSQGQGSVSLMSPGGGAIASEFAGNVSVNNSAFVNNSAPNASGGALLIGGGLGTPAAMDQAYLKIRNSVCSGNTAGQGANSAVLDTGNLGNSPNGVQLDSDGSCL